MNILILHDGYSGVAYHRLIVPFNKIGTYGQHNIYQAGHIEKYDKDGVHHPAPTVDELKASGIDVVIYSRNISIYHRPEEVYARLKFAGISVIIDIDDYWLPSKTNPYRELYKKQNLVKSQINQIKMADAVIVTHPYLRQMIAKEIGRTEGIFAAQNAIDPNQEQFTLDGLSYDYECLYWQGSPTHNADLNLIKNAFDGLIDYKLVLGGYSKINIWNDLLKSFKSVNHDYEEAVGVDVYARMYANKGICLVPLLNNKFNRCKSELKAIEAGWFQKPVIASNVHPYTRLSEAILANNDEWPKYIKGMLGSRQWQDDVRFKLHEEVCQRYLIDKANEHRLEAIDYAVRNKRTIKNLIL